jgi:hypothetical protein
VTATDEANVIDEANATDKADAFCSARPVCPTEPLDLLALRAIIALIFVPAPMPTPSQGAATMIAPSAMPVLGIAVIAPAFVPAAITPTPAPTITPTPASALPTVGSACPTAIAPPLRARVGWLARVAGCPTIALASINGTRTWVRRDTLPDEVYAQLPEVTP